MTFRQNLLCLCATAVFVFLCFFVILKRSFLSVPNDSSVNDSSGGENNESLFADSGPPLPEAKAYSGSPSGSSVADRGNTSKTMFGDKVPNTSSSPQVPITFPDGTLVPQPPERTLADQVKFAKLFVEELDKDPSVIGIFQNPDNGRVYPLYPNMLYVQRRECVNEQGIKFVEGESRFGTATVSNDGPIPAGVRVIELDMNGEPIRDYIASGDFWEFILSQGFDPVTYRDLAAELVSEIEREYYPKETFNASEDRIEDDNWTSGLDNYLEQADDFPTSKAEPLQSIPVDREIRFRSLFHQYEFEKGLQRTEQAEAEIMGGRDRLPSPAKTDAVPWESDVKESVRYPQIP